MRNYRLEEMVCTRRENYEVPCNWKVCVENAMEEYHTPTVHKSQYTERDYPVFLISPDTMFYVIVEPHRPGECVIRMGNCFPASTGARPDFEMGVKRYHNRTSTTLPQDNNACALQQRASGPRRRGRAGTRCASSSFTTSPTTSWTG
jgi:phenylpropionate dioxygenase-like ring-hydroxylating dioxygenase large terminal subunit